MQDFHELHLRIVSPHNHHTYSPFISKLPAGLHAFFTPLEYAIGNNLCFELSHALGTDIALCSDDELDPFTRPPILSERFASASSYQYFHGPDALSILSTYIRSQLCPTLDFGSDLHQLCHLIAKASNAAYVDYDYDAISHALTVTILSPPSTAGYSRQNTLPPAKYRSDHRLEVGILAPEDAKEPEELKLGGFLAVVGDDEKPGATLFSFPSRHHPLPPEDKLTYNVSFQKPSGLHPKLEITFAANQLKPPKDSCALHAYWTIPSSLFIDRYQLEDKLFFESQKLVALRAISGEQDLEAPNWAIKKWGSASLFELAVPNASQREDSQWTATIPTHLRYINDTASISGYSDIQVPWPNVFWACEAEDGLKMNVNPFDRVNLGYDGLFGPKTMFYHVPADEQRETLVEGLRVPVLSPSQSSWVPFATVLAVLVGFAWVCWKLLGGGATSPSPPVKHEKKKS